MTKLVSALAATAAVLTLAGVAQAQPSRAPTATLYDQPDFKGNSVTITRSAPDLGKWRFNDRAQSARFEGRWTICEHDDFRGRCQEVSGALTNLNAFGLMQQVSSLEPAGRATGPGVGNGGSGRDAPGIVGARTVFFPRPTVRGIDVAAGSRGADVYCRQQGLGGAVWYDSSERAAQAVGPEGQFVGRSTVLRDLLCRKS